jgi:hypothetical protein
MANPMDEHSARSIITYLDLTASRETSQTSSPRVPLRRTNRRSCRVRAISLRRRLCHENLVDELAAHSVKGWMRCRMTVVQLEFVLRP